jgi:hypothetical protein
VFCGSLYNIEKENGMKKVYEYIVYNSERILWEGKVLAVDENQARLLIPLEMEDDEIDFSDEDTKVKIRSFC